MTASSPRIPSTKSTDTKDCKRCGDQFPLADFIPDPRRADGRGSYCRPCYRAIALASSTKWNARHPEKRRAIARRQNLRRIGWTPEAFDEAMEAQGGLCANQRCRRAATHADHDHDTGARRAILCGGCNIALGHLAEDPERIVGLAEFIRPYRLVAV